jgi:hypothetical protein
MLPRAQLRKRLSGCPVPFFHCQCTLTQSSSAHAARGAVTRIERALASCQWGSSSCSSRHPSLDVRTTYVLSRRLASAIATLACATQWHRVGPCAENFFDGEVYDAEGECARPDS